MEQPKEFSYWKKPWLKWLVFSGAVLQMPGLYARLQEYRAVSRPEIRTKLFSQSGWENYAAEQYFQISMSILLIGLFLGSFVIGIFARSKKTADISTGILLIIFALFWCTIGFSIPVSSNVLMMTMWILVLMVLSVGGMYTLWTSRRV